MTDYDLLHATWPPASLRSLGPFTLRDGGGGGKRVSAASVEGTPTDPELDTAEKHTDLFAVRPDQTDFDMVLADRGYELVDPTLILSCDVAALTTPEPSPVSGFTVWPPLQVQRDIWAEGGIGPARLAVMDRVTGPKTSILGRAQDKPAGAAFVAIHGGTVMVHAVEVRAGLRRFGLATHMMRHAARWAQVRAATRIAVLVTEANTAAIALYRGLGLTGGRCYHYRSKPKDTRP
ncbi:Acetyltransferase (GNAT) family protein [Rhodobacteraceae bacterium THAF1]|uniref:GNAT family N-acetyltransferase n=1 Tax=Palleronia sp. THAF1 TaxID=2587842 RepID=UPI000F3C55F1|nr:GNAT family N-acetyltransferase [Palleronia sp. THAF1]QFU07076.1 Acetyltransferase (GNAT) family protein [Palleronia sp. THAF1]VDC16771.1 Acetyltransferase (GNAT) family protein [Rhodobacteraceae bacterium THAF1]